MAYIAFFSSLSHQKEQEEKVNRMGYQCVKKVYLVKVKKVNDKPGRNLNRPRVLT